MGCGQREAPWRTPEHDNWVVATAFSPDGKRALTGSSDGTARLWDVDTGKPLGAPLLHQGNVTMVAFSPSGKTVATTSFDSTARLWGVPAPIDGEVEQIFFWTQVMTAMELGPDGAASHLDAPTWQERRKQLMKLGGPLLRVGAEQ